MCLNRVIAVSSSGGHLTELIGVLPINIVDEILYVTSFDERSEDLLKVHKNKRYITDPNGELKRYFINFFESVNIVIRERPKVVISTGSGIAVFILVLSWVIGSKIIYVESGARLYKLSKTGCLLYRFADLFIVRSEVLLSKYPKAVRARLF